MSGPDRPDDFDFLWLEVIVRAEAGNDTAVLRKLDDLFARSANRSDSTRRDLLQLQDNAALLLAEHHHLEVAIELARRSLSERTRPRGADHPNSLAVRHNLAFWLGESGDAATHKNLALCRRPLTKSTQPETTDEHLHAYLPQAEIRPTT
jgi:hypothetical protein